MMIVIMFILVSALMMGPGPRSGPLMSFFMVVGFMLSFSMVGGRGTTAVVSSVMFSIGFMVCRHHSFIYIF